MVRTLGGSFLGLSQWGEGACLGKMSSGFCWWVDSEQTSRRPEVTVVVRAHCAHRDLCVGNRTLATARNMGNKVPHRGQKAGPWLSKLSRNEGSGLQELDWDDHADHR